MVEPVRYAIDPTEPFPKRWLDKEGSPIRVMCEPVQGYVLARRLHCIPFAIAVSDLLNANRFPHNLGPFTVALRTKTKRLEGGER